MWLMSDHPIQTGPDLVPYRTNQSHAGLGWGGFRHGAVLCGHLEELCA